MYGYKIKNLLRMVVTITGFALFVMSQYDAIFAFPNQRFGEF